MSAGRPSLFTPQRAALIVAAIREGCSLGAAARIAGIGETTLHDWRVRGDAELEQATDADAEATITAAQLHNAAIVPNRSDMALPRTVPPLATYAAFAQALECALAECERSIIRHVVKAAEKDWRAGAWWLERRRPEVYGRAPANAQPKAADEQSEVPEHTEGLDRRAYIESLTPEEREERRKVVVAQLRAQQVVSR